MIKFFWLFWNLLSLQYISFQHVCINFCSRQLSFELIIEDSWFFKFHHLYWDDLRKIFFSFIIQSRHFIVGRFSQKRIHCNEMDWELWIRKILKIFSISLKPNSRHFMIKPIIQSISLQEWYNVSMIMGIGNLFESR